MTILNIVNYFLNFSKSMIKTRFSYYFTCIFTNYFTQFN